MEPLKSEAEPRAPAPQLLPLCSTPTPVPLPSLSPLSQALPNTTQQAINSLCRTEDKPMVLNVLWCWGLGGEPTSVPSKTRAGCPGGCWQLWCWGRTSRVRAGPLPPRPLSLPPQGPGEHCLLSLLRSPPALTCSGSEFSATGAGGQERAVPSTVTGPSPLQGGRGCLQVGVMAPLWAGPVRPTGHAGSRERASPGPECHPDLWEPRCCRCLRGLCQPGLPCPGSSGSGL